MEKGSEEPLNESFIKYSHLFNKSFSYKMWMMERRKKSIDDQHTNKHSSYYEPKASLSDGDKKKYFKLKSTHSHVSVMV